VSSVAITRSTYADFKEKVSEIIEGAGGLELSPGNNVVIKINLCDFRMPETGAITHPLFLHSVLWYLHSRFKNLNISVVESDATATQADLLFRWLGIENVVRKYEACWVNLSKVKSIKKEIKGHYFHEIDVPKVIEDSDCLITMAKLKTCLLTKISCSLKNQFGCIPIRRKIKFHPVIDDAIVDANLAMRPDFCFVDGIIAMGDKGPDLGIPIRADVVISGKDPVSVDATCARLMGFNPHFVGHIRRAQSSGVGRMSCKVVGERIEDMKKNFEFSGTFARAIKVVNFLRKRSIAL